MPQTEPMDQQLAELCGLVGRSAAMQRVHQQIDAAARGYGAVLLTGESGAGKERAAEAVHQRSGCSGALVVVNCATLPRELAESELFGHRRGAYTGAEQAHPGLVRAAAGGMLFLDEITEMALEMQAKLLRLLDGGSVRAVGTVQEVAVEVRFMASTNRDPHKAIRSGALREDIYHRLNVHRIEMPPLREHPEDVPVLIEHFLEQLAQRGLPRDITVDPAALDLMQRYPWPGNVRELRNAVEAATANLQEPTVRPADLPAAIRRIGEPRQLDLPEGAIPTIEQAEQQLIERALAATGGNKRRAAQLLGISRHRLYDRLRKLERAAPKDGDNR